VWFRGDCRPDSWDTVYPQEKINAAIALAVERIFGKDKVIGSNPIGGSWKLGRVVEGAALEMLLGGLPLPGFESLSFR
jgi:hypothetical protein